MMVNCEKSGNEMKCVSTVRTVAASSTLTVAVPVIVPASAVQTATVGRGFTLRWVQGGGD